MSTYNYGQSEQHPPFTQQLLENTISQGNQESRGRDNSLTALLPASRRTKDDDLTAHTPSIFDHDGIEVDAHQLTGILDWVDQEIDLSRLNAIHDWLWIVGRPMPPRPLHQQRLLNREVVITEKLDLHLVWTTQRIFVKPLPRFLLEPRFWERFLCCDRVPVSCQYGCGCKDLRERALGLLFSYTALIVHESDFHIAKETHLIPEEVHWTTWRTAVRELLDLSPIYALINPRFHYGELRLSRLDKIYFFWKTPLRGYMSHWTQYRSFFQDNFAWLASSTVYIAVVLTAMQVGLATEALQSNAAFQSASYGFTIFSILGPLVAAGLVMVIFFYSFIRNWVATRRYRQQRLQRIEGH